MGIYRQYNDDMNKSQGWVLVFGILVVLAAGAAALVIGIQGSVSRLTNIPDTVGTQAAGILHPTPTIYPDPVTVIQQVRSMARLETVQYSVEKVITAESGQGPFGFLFGDRLLLVAHGNVIAGIDLARMQTNDIRIDPATGTVSMVMPAAEVFSYSLDNSKTYVYSRESGPLAQGSKDLETAARQAAEQQILDAALSDGILQTAQTNGQAFLDRFLLSLGFKRVVFLEATPIPTLQPTATP
jgi:hypothetical protein